MATRRKSGRPKLKYSVKEFTTSDMRSRKEVKGLDLTKYETYFRMYVFFRRLYRHPRFFRYVMRFDLRTFDYLWLEHLRDFRKMVEFSFALVEYRFWRRLLPKYLPEPLQKHVMAEVFWSRLDTEMRNLLEAYFKERNKVRQYILRNSEYNLVRWVAEVEAMSRRELQKLKAELAKERKIEAPGVCNSLTCKIGRFLLRFFPGDKTRFLAYVFAHELTELMNAVRTCVGASCHEIEKRELPRRKYLHEKYIVIAALGYALLAQEHHAVLHTIAGEVIKYFPMYLAWAMKRHIMKWVARAMGCRECYDELTICSILTIPEDVFDPNIGQTVKVTSVKYMNPLGEVKYVPGGRVINYRIRFDWVYLRMCKESGDCQLLGRSLWELTQS